MSFNRDPTVVFLSVSQQHCVDVDTRPFSLYTVVEECKQRLLKFGFVELKEKDSWEVKQEGKVCACVQHD